MLLQTGHWKALCTLPAIPNMGLGKGLNQQTAKEGCDRTEFANGEANETRTRRKSPTTFRSSKDRELKVALRATSMCLFVPKTISSALQIPLLPPVLLLKMSKWQFCWKTRFNWGNVKIWLALFNDSWIGQRPSCLATRKEHEELYTKWKAFKDRKGVGKLKEQIISGKVTSPQGKAAGWGSVRQVTSPVLIRKFNWLVKSYIPGRNRNCN